MPTQALRLLGSQVLGTIMILAATKEDQRRHFKRARLLSVVGGKLSAFPGATSTRSAVRAHCNTASVLACAEQRLCSLVCSEHY